MSDQHGAHISSDRHINQLPGAHINVHNSDYISRDGLIAAFGLDCYIPANRLKMINRHGIKQGIPPAMTHRLASMMFQKLMVGEVQR
jgi:hypothetical protein